MNSIVVRTAASVIANESQPSLGPGIPRACLATLSTNTGVDSAGESETSAKKRKRKLMRREAKS